MKTLLFFLALASAIHVAPQASADIAFLKDRCLIPFSAQADALPLNGLTEINSQGASFYQDPKSRAVLSGDLGGNWLRACNVGWSMQEEAAATIAQWQSVMQQLGVTAPRGCVKTVAGDVRVFAASQQPNAQGFYVLGQLEITGGGTKAWAQISEQDAPYPLRLECPDAF